MRARGVLVAHACARSRSRAGILGSAATAELVFPAELISPARFAASFFGAAKMCFHLALAEPREGGEGSGDGWQSTARASRPERSRTHRNLARFSSSGSSVKCFLSTRPSLLLPPPPHCSSMQRLGPILLPPRALPGCQLDARPTDIWVLMLLQDEHRGRTALDHTIYIPLLVGGIWEHQRCQQGPDPHLKTRAGARCGNVDCARRIPAARAWRHSQGLAWGFQHQEGQTPPPPVANPKPGSIPG